MATGQSAGYAASGRGVGRRTRKKRSAQKPGRGKGRSGSDRQQEQGLGARGRRAWMGGAIGAGSGERAAGERSGRGRCAGGEGGRAGGKARRTAEAGRGMAMGTRGRKPPENGAASFGSGRTVRGGRQGGGSGRKGNPARSKTARPAKQPAAGRRHRAGGALATPAGLTVQLAITVLDGTHRDEKKVSLQGVIQAAPGRSKARAVRLLDRVSAARRVSQGARPDELARLLAAVAHPQRIRILLKLLGGEATYRLLAKTTGLKAGPLYHHLRELRSAGLIGPKVRDLYALTRTGRRMILAALALGRLRH